MRTETGIGQNTEQELSRNAKKDDNNITTNNK
jgi:hypothetical protein